MPSRVRIVGSHPNYGVYRGNYLYKFVEYSWGQKFVVPIEQMAPQLFAVWPRWKRILWIAKAVGNWQIKAFREARRAKINKSLYGKYLISRGIPIPPLKKKVLKPPVVNRRKKVVGNKFMVGEVGEAVQVNAEQAERQVWQAVNVPPPDQYQIGIGYQQYQPQQNQPGAIFYPPLQPRGVHLQNPFIAAEGPPQNHQPIPIDPEYQGAVVEHEYIDELYEPPPEEI